MTSLTVYGVFAPDELRFVSELRVVPRKEMPFVPFGDEWRYFFTIWKGHNRVTPLPNLLEYLTINKR